MNSGTATMMKLFIAVNMDCAAMESGRLVMVAIQIMDAIPRDTAMGTPKNISTKKININAKLTLIVYSPLLQHFFFFLFLVTDGNFAMELKEAL